MNTTITTEDTKAVTCQVCGHAATMYIFPHHFAGIWECDNGNCGASDNCEHANTTIIDAADYGTIEICNFCGREL